MSRRSPKSSARKRAPRGRSKGGSRSQRWLLRFGWLLPVAALLIGGGILGLTYAFARIPLPSEIELPSSAEVYDVHGRLIGTYSDEIRRFLIDTTELPEYIGEAVVSAEDRDFYDHSGVSIRGIFRAGWANLTGGEIRQGGSTITQQYIKNAVLQDPERTITRKIKEAVLALKLERRYSKREILGFYLNTIYLGRGAYGFEAAARSYFGYRARPGRPAAAQLTLGQGAYLAGIIPAPESYQPDENPGGAIARRDRVLDLMEEEGHISAAEVQAAKAEKLRIARDAIGSVVKRQRAAYFMEWLRRDFLYPEYEGELFTGGLKIYTTLDLDAQDAAEGAVATMLPNPTDPQAALVSMTPKGEIRALVGGRDFTNVKKARGFDFATDHPGRQAGSSFKPFTLLTAIEEGISPQSTFSGSSPRLIPDPECANPDASPWEVENFGGASYGSMTLDQATTNSVNTIYAQLAAEVGPAKIVDLLGDFGFDREPPDHREVPAVCSLSLGTLDVTPLEMARAYAGFAGRGALPEVMPIRYIKDSHGSCIKVYRSDRDAKDCEEEDNASTDQVVEENSADVLNQTLTHVVSGGTATAANLPDGRPVAGKTGTTQNHANAWFAGYVPQLATVVWMGYPLQERSVPCDEATATEIGVECKDGRTVEPYVPLMESCADTKLCRPVVGDLGYPIEVTGGSFPARIWAAFMAVFTAELEPLPFPVPTDLPDEVINPQPVITTRPSPKKPRKPEPKPTEKGTKPTPVPTGSPNPIPSDSGGPDDDD